MAFFLNCSEVEIEHNEENVIYVNESSLELFCGETRQLTASPTESTFSWVSEDPEIADVDVHGMVTVKVRETRGLWCPPGIIRNMWK